MSLTPAEARRLCAALGVMWFGGVIGAAGQQGRVWSIATTPDVEIGGAFGEDAYTFQSIAAAHFLPDDRIIVADFGTPDLRIYGKDGRIQKRIGRRGQGPGEFMHIEAMWLTSKGTIAVWDARLRRLTTFNSEGHLERSHSVAGASGSGTPSAFLESFENDDLILASLSLGPSGSEAVPDKWLLVRFSLDGKFIGPLGSVRGMWRFNRNPVPFSPMPITVIYRDSLYIADGYEGEISVRNGKGEHVRRIALPPVNRVASNVVWSSLETKLRELRRSASTPFVVNNLAHLENNRIPRSSRFPQVGGLIADDRGYIWAKAYDPINDSIWLKGSPFWVGAGGEWRVIRPDGALVTTLRVKRG